MSDSQLDRIFIRDLALRCVIGLYPDERREKQDVIINISMFTDLREAGTSDNLDASVDYKRVKKNVIAMVEASAFLLVERMAERIAEICLAETRVQKVQVRVDKPGALRFAKSVGVEIFRSR
ncbi:MAG TPA: dihydroneopterin aldolase [Planctomycetota bacterium]